MLFKRKISEGPGGGENVVPLAGERNRRTTPTSNPLALSLAIQVADEQKFKFAWWLCRGAGYGSGGCNECDVQGGHRILARPPPPSPSRANPKEAALQIVRETGLAPVQRERERRLCF